MKGKWKVTSNPIGGKIKYGVHRILDTSKTVHSGNVENYGDYVDTYREAEKIAAFLNREEE